MHLIFSDDFTHKNNSCIMIITNYKLHYLVLIQNKDRAIAGIFQAVHVQC